MAANAEQRCPRCERVLVSTLGGLRCLFCGYDSSLPREASEAGEYSAGVECGLFGLIAGLELGAALAVAGGTGPPNPTALLAQASLAGLLGAVLGGWLGGRLAWSRWRNFRLFLLAACAAGLVVLLAALLSWAGTDGVWFGMASLTALVYLTAVRVTRYTPHEGETEPPRE